MKYTGKFEDLLKKGFAINYNGDYFLVGMGKGNYLFISPKDRIVDTNKPLLAIELLGDDLQQ